MLPGPVVPLRWLDVDDGGPAIVLLDQTRLPGAEVEITCRDVAEVIDAVRRLAVRGAPLLGITGAYAVALAAARGEDVDAAAHDIATARPTAVNLAGGVQAALTAWSMNHDPQATLDAARRLAADDAAASAALVAHGRSLLPPDARILTHCNTGALVSGGAGTALAVALAAHADGGVARLWVGETRPLLQGARLTAWEAARAGAPYSVLADGAAGSLFAAGEVDVVLVGADRIAADGSVANKVGTYPLAVLAHHHGVPFVVVAPTTTIDPATATGAGIVVEQRPAAEVTAIAGRSIAPAGSTAYNPAFDVTPAALVTAIVTERGVAAPVTVDTVSGLLGSEPA